MKRFHDLPAVQLSGGSDFSLVPSPGSDEYVIIEANERPWRHG
jgi:hypothetical protein